MWDILLNILYFNKKSKSRNCLLRLARKERRTVEDAGPYKEIVSKQKTPSQKQWRILSQGSDSPLDLVGTEASGTSVHMAGSTVDNRLDTLHIGLDGTVGTSVGVGNLNTKGHALAAKITLSHSLHLQSKNTHYSPVHRRLDMIADIAEKCKYFFQKNWIFLKILLLLVTAAAIMGS